MVIAVDFDGTLKTKRGANVALIKRLVNDQARGSKIILFTCRTGASLLEAVNYCAGFGLRFDGVCGGKLKADLYIDDKAIRP